MVTKRDDQPTNRRQGEYRAICLGKVGRQSFAKWEMGGGFAVPAHHSLHDNCCNDGHYVQASQWLFSRVLALAGWWRGGQRCARWRPAWPMQPLSRKKLCLLLKSCQWREDGSPGFIKSWKSNIHSKVKTNRQKPPNINYKCCPIPLFGPNSIWSRFTQNDEILRLKFDNS